MKHSSHKSGRRTASAIAMAATLAATPLSFVAANAHAGEKDSLAVSKNSAVMPFKFGMWKDKWPGTLAIVGLDNGHTIYKNANGEMFYLDPNTGDQKFISKDIYIKYSASVVKGSVNLKNSSNASMLKLVGIKGESQLTILGVDANGNVVQQNSSGQKFYLNPSNGDMVFVK